MEFSTSRKLKKKEKDKRIKREMSEMKRNREMKESQSAKNEIKLSKGRERKDNNRKKVRERKTDCEYATKYR